MWGQVIRLLNRARLFYLVIGTYVQGSDCFMVAVTILILAASIWLLWEWRTGALSPDAPHAGRRDPVTAVEVRSLPTSAALNADAAVVARIDPRA